MDLIANPVTSYIESPDAPSRSGAERFVSVHRYLPFAIFYFFLNRAGLPVGTFYTSLLSPVLYVWLYLKGRRWITTKFLLVLFPFMLVHFILGVTNPLEYLRTLAHWWTVYVAAYAICVALSKSRSIDQVFEQLILLNFFASVLGLVLFPTPLRSFFWMDTGETIVGAAHSLRLNLLSTEPSAYAELMFPLLVFAALRFLCNSKMRNAAYLFMITVPFLLAQSFGGVSIGIAGIGISLLTGYRQLLSRPKARLSFLLLALAIAAVLLVPNPISARVLQVMAGGDGSTKGRTIFAYIAAYTVATTKSLWWGVGLGQSKYVDFSDLGFGMDGHIPNQVAGIFAEFGIFGVSTFLATEFYLFFKTKVYLNSFRIAMFVVAFINQFTGSYGTDLQQYLIWFLAFYPLISHVNLRDDSGRRCLRS